MISSAAPGSAAAANMSVLAGDGAAPSSYPATHASPFLASQPLAWARSRPPSSTVVAAHAEPLFATSSTIVPAAGSVHHAGSIPPGPAGSVQTDVSMP
jgi:hypothetical protein